MREDDGPRAVFTKSQQALRAAAILKAVAQYIGLAVALAGIIITAGWIFQLPALNSLFTGSLPMKANTAACFVFTGLAIWLLRTEAPSSMSEKIQRYLACLLASLAAVIGTLSMLEYMFNWNAGIDELIARDFSQSTATFLPGRMSFYTGLNFLICGLSLLLLDVKSGNRRLSLYLIVVVGLIGLTSTLGYIYNAPELFGLQPYRVPALTTSVGFLLVFLAVLMTRPNAGIAALLVENYPGHLFLRLIIPGVTILLILTGWLRLQSTLLGQFSAELKEALCTIINIVIISAAVIISAWYVFTADSRRRRAETQAQELNASLERQVEQRTADVHASEKKYHTIFENAVEGIFQTTPEGRFISVNPAVARMAGFSSPNELINSVDSISGKMYVHPEDRNRLLELLENEGVASNFEYEARHRDGSIIWLSANVRPVKDENGNITCLEGTVVDITGRKRSEAALRESEEKYHSIFDNAGEAICIVQDGRIKLLNKRSSKLSRYSEAELLGRPFVEFIHPEDREMLVNRYLVRMRGGEVEPSYTFRFIDKDGNILWLEQHATLIDWEGSPATLNFLNDITGRKQMEEALRESEEQYRFLFENMLDGFGYCRMIFEDGRPQDFEYIVVNSAFEKLTGWKNVAGKKISEIVPVNSNLARQVLEIYGRVALTGTPEMLEIYSETMNKWLNISVYSPKKGFFVNVFEVITDRKLAEEALKRSEAKYRLLAENSADVIWTVDPAMHLTYVSPSVIRLLCCSQDEIMLRPLAEIMTPQSAQFVTSEMEHFKEELSQGGANRRVIESELYCSDGSSVWTETMVRANYDNTGELTGFTGISRDITGRKTAEKALQESEEKYRSIFENAVEGIFQSTPQGKYISVNPAFARIGGFSSAEEMINSVSDIQKELYAHPEDRARLIGLLKSQDTVNNFEAEIKRRDGALIWVSMNVRPVKDQDGNIICLEGTLVDITGRKQADEALKESEKLYHSLFENMLNGLAYCRMLFKDGRPQDYVYIAVNNSFEKLTGLKDVAGKKVSEVIPGIRESDPELFEICGRVALTGTPEVFELYIASLKTWFYLSVYSPQKEYFIAVFDVITDRKQAEEKLRESEEKFRSIFDNSAIGKSITSIDGIVNPNQSFADLLGYSKDELSHTRWQDISFPADIENTEKQLELLKSGRMKSARFIKRYVKKDGSLVWADVHTVLHKDKDNNPLYFITAVMDITERKKAEEELENTAIFLNNMVEQSPVATWVSDDKGTLLRVNRALCDMFQITEEELIGKYNVFSDNMVEEQGHMPLVRDVFEKGEVARFELHYDSSQLKEIPLDKTRTLDLAITIFPVRDAAGRITNAVIQEADLTERKKAEEKLLMLTAELQRSNIELERFAYIASHDLQEPLRTISSYLQLLERRYREKLDERATRYIDFTVEGANRLQEMISGLLEYSRVETRGQPFIPVNCQDLLGQTIDNLQHAIKESQAEITHGQLPTVMGDRVQLLRLFQNLLSNAIKYRSEKPLCIHISAERKPGEWVFAVSDNGIGIDPEYKDQIFIIFQRLHGRDVPGIGLGLPVARKIVERHGGRIWVESEPGKGATFYFTIPSNGIPRCNGNGKEERDTV